MKDHLNEILKFQKDRDWKQFHSPKNLAISLSLEASEILELFQWSKDNQLPEDKKQKLEEEIADVYYYLLLLAHENGVDIDAAFRNKMKKNAKKYPVDKAKGTSKKYTEL
jgi:NTP pyrophosphatase (non-canonical NTP hydrolase)